MVKITLRKKQIQKIQTSKALKSSLESWVILQAQGSVGSTAKPESKKNLSEDAERNSAAQINPFLGQIWSVALELHGKLSS